MSEEAKKKEKKVTQKALESKKIQLEKLAKEIKEGEKAFAKEKEKSFTSIIAKALLAAEPMKKIKIGEISKEQKKAIEGIIEECAPLVAEILDPKAKEEEKNTEE